jgi:hypothetical protein
MANITFLKKEHPSAHGQDHAHHEDESVLFGVVAEFDDPDDLMAAANAAREAGYVHMDAFSPFPIHGMPEAIGFHDVKVPWAIFGAGAAGLITGIVLQVWTSTVAYPMNVGGRPKISWPSFIPVAYECTILFAGLTAVLSVILFNGLPKPYHPVFNAPNFDRASQDKFFLSLEARDDHDFDTAKAEAFLNAQSAKNVTVVMADEAGEWAI